MKKQILEELNGIKYLFNYNRGKVISEQEQFESEDVDFEEIDFDEDDEEDINYLKGQFEEGYEFEDEYNDMEIDEELIEDRGVEVPVKPDIKTPTKPKKPGTPYRPKPGPKPDPKAKRKGDMPDWLTFDELGIDFE
jgi:hypothetical protein